MIEPQKTTGCFTRFMCKVIPLAFDESMSYYECLCALRSKVEELINANNTNAEAITELQTLFENLKSYVDNYFNNLDVQNEINNKLDILVEDGTLERLINDKILSNIESNVQNMYDQIKFKPKVYASMYMLDHDTDTIKERILKWKQIGCTGIITLINLNNDDNLTILDDMNKVNELMSYAKENGLAVDTLKFHCLLRDRVDETTLNTYLDQVKSVITQTNAKEFGIKRITIFNELPYVYGANATEETKANAINIISEIQMLGFEVGITCSNLELGLGYMIEYSPNLCDAVDFFAYNYYQAFPFKKELTNYEDSMYAWKTAFDSTYTYKQQYPNKNIILSETGCLDNWLNMMNPSDFTLNQYPAHGKTYPVYFYGLLNNQVANTNLSEVWLWYDEVLTNYPNVIDFFNYYLGGDLNA